MSSLQFTAPSLQNTNKKLDISETKPGDLTCSLLGLGLLESSRWSPLCGTGFSIRALTGGGVDPRNLSTGLGVSTGLGF